MSDKEDNDKGSLFDFFVGAVILIAGLSFIKGALKGGSEKETKDTAKTSEPATAHREAINMPKEASTVRETEKKKKCPLCGYDIKSSRPNECSYCGARKCEAVKEDGRVCGKWVPRSEYRICIGPGCDKVFCTECDCSGYCSSLCYVLDNDDD